MEVLLGLFAIIALTLALLFYNSFSWGYVSYVLYGWFILPTFPEAPQLSVLQFVGIALFLSVIKPNSTPSLKKEYEDNGAKWGRLILTPWLILLFSWVVHLLY